MRREIDVLLAHRLLDPGPVVLVTAHHRGRFDITPVQWVTTVSARPPMVAIALHVDRFSHELIRASGEFVLNVPPLDLVRQVKQCAEFSGRDVDKFARTGLHMAEPKAVRPPLIEECIGHLECAVETTLTPGDHTIFVAHVVYAWAESDLFDDKWLITERELRPLHHLGGNYYGVIEERLDYSDKPAAESAGQ